MNSKQSRTASVCPGTLQRLREAGIQPTRQRLQIARLLFDHGGHLTAQDLFELINRDKPTVCRATVYNTLNLMADRGLVREICLDSNRTVYDTNTEPHHHLYNVDTGELTDVPLEAVAFQRLPNLPRGTRQEDINLVVRVRNRQSLFQVFPEEGAGSE